MRKTFIITVAFLAVMCSKAETEKPQTEISTLPDGGRTVIKVMSSNVRNGESDTGDSLWCNRRNAYIAMLSDTQPDIVGMQEAKAETAADMALLPEYEVFRVAEYDGSNPTVLQDHLPPNLIMFRKSRFEKLDAGVFYYNEEDPGKPVHYPFGASGWQVRGCVWTKLKVKANGQIIYFFDTHFTHDPEVTDAEGNKIFNIEPRRKASQLIVSQIEKLVGEQKASVFVVGDLNCSLYDGSTRNGAYSLEPLTEYMWSARDEAAYYDGAVSFNGFDLTYNKKIGNIDHIFYRGAESMDFITVNGHDYGKTFISDHYPVTCTFKL